MPIRIGHWLQGIWIGISKLFHKVEDEVKKAIPVAINVVEQIKKVLDSPVADVITAIIPGDADDKLRAKLQLVLPGLILKFQLVAAIGDIADENEKFQAILKAINLSPDETKNVFYHGLASLILESISDGKLSWSDATAICQYYYEHEFKHAA